MSARGYLAAAGAALLALAALGLATQGAAGSRWFAGGPAQAAIHAILGIAALAAAFATRRASAARALAILLLALGALGILTPGLFGYPARTGLALRWEIGENAAHLALGAWGAYVAGKEGD